MTEASVHLTQRRQTLPVAQKRRKPRRQSGLAVAFENRESVVQKARVERTDSDKVIRRNSMARKLSVRNSMTLPADFLEGLKGLDESLTRMSLVAAATTRGGKRPSLAEALAKASGSAEDDKNTHASATTHGPEFSEAQLRNMSEQALQISDDDEEESEEESVVSEVMEETMEDL